MKYTIATEEDRGRYCASAVDDQREAVYRSPDMTTLADRDPRKMSVPARYLFASGRIGGRHA